MILGRLRRYRQRILREFQRSLEEDHSPKEIARSFSLGAFITMLPTLGTGLILFVVLVYLFKWINKIALFASVIVFNPVVKWGVYAASFSIGVLILGPVEGISTAEVSLSAGPAIVIRLLLGNLILAVIATVFAYVFAYRIAIAYDRSKLGDIIDESLGELVEEVIDDDGPAQQAADRSSGEDSTVD